jgi:hypothetical protein
LVVRIAALVLAAVGVGCLPGDPRSGTYCQSGSAGTSCYPLHETWQEYGQPPTEANEMNQVTDGGQSPPASGLYAFPAGTQVSPGPPPRQSPP